MDFRITEEQRAFVDTVRRVCQKDFKSRAIKYLDGTWPAENMRQLAEIGVLGMAVPQEYGGSGLGILDTVLVLEEIGKVCYVTAMAALGELACKRASSPLTRPGWRRSSPHVSRVMGLGGC